jgi:cysteine desulfurase/selenocysteine lyase
MDKERSNFPIFTEQKDLIYLDSAATSLKPQIVIQAINDYNQKFSINSHSETGGLLFKQVWTTINEARKIIAQKIKVPISEISFLPSATYALNILALSLQGQLREGDKILLTHLEHSSNLYPWQAIAQKKKVIIDYLPLNEEFIIDIDKLDKYIDQRTKIVSFFHVSNSLGEINPVEKIVSIIKKINPNCLIILDACQSIARFPIEPRKWNIDALVFSGHKVYGPTGIGVLWVKKETGQKLSHLLWGGGKTIGPRDKTDNCSLSQKFEVGTLPLAEIFGLKDAFEFLDQLDLSEVCWYENNLRNYALQKLKKIPNLIIYNQNSNSTNIVTFNLPPYHAHDIANYLGKNNIYVRAGNFCCPFLNKVINTDSALRISLAMYNNHHDIDKLISYLQKIIRDPQLLLPF